MKKIKVSRSIREALLGGGVVWGTYIIMGILFSESGTEFFVMGVVGLVYGLLSFISYPVAEDGSDMLNTGRVYDKFICHKNGRAMRRIKVTAHKSKTL